MTQLLQNAFYGAVMILAVAALRGVLRDRLVPEARLALWAVCLFRLFTPAAPTSALSLWGLLGREVQDVSAPAASVSAPNGAGVFVPAALGTANAPIPTPAETGIAWDAVLGFIWIAVGAVLAVRFVLSYARTRRAVDCAVPVGREDPRYHALPRCARLREGPVDGAPLTFGVVRPAVVLTPGLDGAALECVLAHEGVHARRRDNLWHYAMAAALAAFWWNPAVWLMARLLRRDVELSCDRAAVKKLGADRRAEYANALVSMATQGKDPAFCQTFGRKAAEERIISVMKYKKMTIIGGALTLALVLAVTVGFASNPGEQKNDTVEYHGRTYNRSELSQETLDWLDWYLSLSEEGQMSVSMVPPELIDGLNVGAGDSDAGDAAELVDLERYKAMLNKLVAEAKMTREDADYLLAGAEDAVNGGGVNLFASARGSWIAVTADACTRSDCGNNAAHTHDGVTYSGWVNLSVPASICGQVDSCTIARPHWHENGQVVYPAPYAQGDGQHPCGVEGCTETRLHGHGKDFTFLLGPTCTVKGCTVTGSHLHEDGVSYSCNGAGHSGGVCDGSCYYFTGFPEFSEPVNSSGSTGHHGSYTQGNEQAPAGEMGLTHDPQGPEDSGEICHLPLAPTESEIPDFVPDYDPRVEDSVGAIDEPIACPPEVIDKTFPSRTDCYPSESGHHSDSHHSSHH